MNKRPALIVALLLVLPLVLAACGSPAGNAEKFLKAVNDGDKDEAEKYVCDENKEDLVEDIGNDDGTSAEDIKCEADGDDVKCTMTLEQEGEDDQEVTLVFGMEDGKVCEIKGTE
jgi:hypothetical protein